MSEDERRELSFKIRSGIHKAQRQLFERKAKLGETVVIGDKDGNPITVSALDALKTLGV